MRKERLQNGKVYINYVNIDYLEVRAVEGQIKLFYPYRPKLKIEMVELPKSFNTIIDCNKHMIGLEYIKVGQYYINKNRYCIVSEGDLSKRGRKVTFQMQASTLEVEINENEWLAIKNSKLY